MTTLAADSTEIQILVPTAAPVLTAGAGRALLRILRDHAASQPDDHGSVQGATESPALAS